MSARFARVSAALAFAAALPALAEDLSSASFTSRGGHVSAGGANLIGPSFSGGGSAGQAEAIGASGAESSLTSQAGGFWPIVRGGFPSLDSDGDGRQAFLDPDDDGDGLDDLVETNTGVFVSPTDTGTDPNDFDSDGDGLADGFEVDHGTNPNDASSPGPAPIPSLPLPALLSLMAALAAVGARALRGDER